HLFMYSRRGYHDFRSSSVPSLPSGPYDTSAMLWAPGGRLAPHSILIGWPHASLASRPFAYSVRSSIRSGHIACGCAIDQARNAWLASISSFICVVSILAPLDDREPRWPVIGPAIDLVARRVCIAHRRIAATTPGLVEPRAGPGSQLTAGQ